MQLVLYMEDVSPPVRAVLLTAKALGLQMEHRCVDFMKAHLNTDLLKVNPQHTIPTLVDNGQAIWDSHAIIQYLVEKYANDDALYPKDFLKRAAVNQRLHFDSGVLFPPVRKIMRGASSKALPSIPEDMVQAAYNAYDFLESFLEGNLWVAGDSLTIADFSLITSVTALDIIAPIHADKFKKISAWIKRMEGLPYYKSENNAGHEDLKKLLKNYIV